jgi:hypothetical protein
MKNVLKAVATATIMAVGFAQNANATPILYFANLSGANEVPPSGSAGTGIADVYLDPVANTMRVLVTFSGLGSGTTASHIHCCLASPFLSGVNVGVATTLPTFTGFPLGVTSGSYDHTFDMTLASSYNPTFVTAHGGTPALAESALFAGIGAGETYLNIHTTTFGGGEIRGFLIAAPEPATIAVFGFGLAGLGFARRKRAAAQRVERKA